MIHTKLKFAVVVSRFNTEVTSGLLEGAKKYFASKEISGKQLDVIWAPGAFEIPLIAKKLAHTKRYAGVVCLGAVIKGESAHFEFISLGTTIGLMQSMLETEIPITFGILTTYDDAQAEARSALDEHNKGREAAAACHETVQTLAEISS